MKMKSKKETDMLNFDDHGSDTRAPMTDESPDTRPWRHDPDLPRIYAILKDLGLSLRLLAKTLGLQQGSFMKMMRGGWPLNPELLPWLTQLRDAAGGQALGLALIEALEIIHEQDEIGDGDEERDPLAWLEDVYAVLASRPESLRMKIYPADLGEV